jgi:hypothetical protein
MGVAVGGSSPARAVFWGLADDDDYGRAFPSFLVRLVMMTNTFFCFEESPLRGRLMMMMTKMPAAKEADFVYGRVSPIPPRALLLALPADILTSRLQVSTRRTNTVIVHAVRDGV